MDIILFSSDVRRLVAAILTQALKDLQWGEQWARLDAYQWITTTGVEWADLFGIGLNLQEIERLWKTGEGW